MTGSKGYRGIVTGKGSRRKSIMLGLIGVCQQLEEPVALCFVIYHV